MFEEAQLYSPVTTDGGAVTVHLHDGHPGANDPAYRARRNEIAAAALRWQPGEPAPLIDYHPDEQAVWRTVCRELAPLHERHAVGEFRAALSCVALPTAHVPGLDEVSARVGARTGWRYVPAAGLVDLRTFYGALAGRTFHSTQYVRHPALPLYTPEPDIVHEVIGHGHLLATPTFGELHRRAGAAARRLRCVEALRFLSRVFWFTLEFGVVVEDGELRAYGAGSSRATASWPSSAPWTCARSTWPRWERRTTTSRRTSRSCTARSPSPRSKPSPAASSTPAPTSRSRSCAVSTLSPDPLHRAHAARDDHMPLHGIDHLELWVGNAAQAAYVFAHAFGFTEVAYAGLETGLRDCTSHVLQQGRIRLVLTGSLGASGDVAAHHRAHGDGVKVVALGVPDVAVAYHEALARGAKGVLEPYDLYDEHGTVRLAEIAAYGDTVHRFVERDGYDGPFLPGYVEVAHAGDPSQPGLLAGIDHVVANVELGAMDRWVKYYEDVFGMRELIHFSDEAISTEYSALMSKVVTSGDGRVKFPINEPAESKRRSQIDEYLDYYGGPGVQHIAVSTTDIVATVAELSARGVKFLRTPESYYAQLPERIGDIDESLEDLRRLGILVDRDAEGYLLQIFTKPLGDRPTIFFEIIERHGARGFGEGNFKALFQAIEREQALRGNL